MADVRIPFQCRQRELGSGLGDSSKIFTYLESYHELLFKTLHFLSSSSTSIDLPADRNGLFVASTPRPLPTQTLRIK